MQNHQGQRPTVTDPRPWRMAKSHRPTPRTRQGRGGRRLGELVLPASGPISLAVRYELCVTFSLCRIGCLCAIIRNFFSFFVFFVFFCYKN